MSTEALSIDSLERWVLFGAHWRIVELTDRHATVEFCACTGEPVQRLGSEDPALIDYLRSAAEKDADPDGTERSCFASTYQREV